MKLPPPSSNHPSSLWPQRFKQAALALVVALACSAQADELKPAVSPVAPPSRDPIKLPRLVDVAGNTHTFGPGAFGPVVLAWTAPDCPMAKVYAPRLLALAAELIPQGIQFLLVDSSPDATAEKLRAAAKGDLPVICDQNGDLARLVGARSTTEAILLDRDGRVVYRGAVDDQYGYRTTAGIGAGTFRKDAPKQNYLHAAVEALLAGKTPATAATDPMGCVLEIKPVAAAAEAKPPVFYGDVEHVFRAHCQECHGPGGNGPFPLVTYENVQKHARMIAKVVAARRMPPWSASPKYGHFVNDPSLTDAEIAKLTTWIKADLPLGDIAQALPPPVPRADWQIGKPDLVFNTEPFEIPAEGQVPYRYLSLPTNLTEDRWVEATQIVSTPSQVVHHVLAFIAQSAPPAPGVTRPWTPHFDPMNLIEGVKPEDRMKWVFRFMPYIMNDLNAGGGGGLNGSFATSLAAGQGMIYPPGRAKLLPAGSNLILQMHYTPDGTKHTVNTRIGLRFAKKPPTEPVDSRSAATVAFEIPPGDANYEVKSTRIMPRDALLLSLRPHMHVRGKTFRYVATFPDGKEETLLEVPNWDFEWQVEYVLAQPRRLPAGTKLSAIATYDNSTANPNNPDPTKSVFFGLQSTEEMMIGYYEVVWGKDPNAVAVQQAMPPAVATQ